MMFIITWMDSAGQHTEEIDCWPDLIAWLAEYKPRSSVLSNMSITTWGLIGSEPPSYDEIHDEALLENFLYDSEQLAKDHEKEQASL